MSEQRRVVLILGGYGVFGGRLARLLADEPGLSLIIAGRSGDKAAAFCKGLPSRATLVPVALDRESDDFENRVAGLRADFVVDATGPFQAYGVDPYRVIRICLEHGLHYLDFADGADFVVGVSRFDDEAKARDLLILSGASSFPVLTAAAARALSDGFSRVDSITAGLAPSPYAGVGLNVIRAVAGYAGQRVALVRRGRKTTGRAFAESIRATIAPPGRLPLRNTRFSLVDVPDLQLLPIAFPEARSVWMGAGPVPEILHRLLNALAQLVRLRILPSLSPFARLFHIAISTLRWGEHRGGMFVTLAGEDSSGRRLERSWHLLAEGGDGPLIPSMTIEAIIRKDLAGARLAAGARPAVDALTLADYEARFSGRMIFTGFRESSPEERRAPLYRKILGDAWESLPPPIQAMHDLQSDAEATGFATVERGAGRLSRIIGALFGLPSAGTEVPVDVLFRVENAREIWRRNFAGRVFSSVQSEGRGRFERLLCERFGPFVFGLALVLDGDRLRLAVRRWTAWGVPAPLALAPRGEAYESVEDGRFCFHVEISHPLTGLIVRYRGRLNPPVEVGRLDSEEEKGAAHREQEIAYSERRGVSAGGAGKRNGRDMFQK